MPGEHWEALGAKALVVWPPSHALNGGSALVTFVATYADERDQSSPLGFYRKYGFEPTGEINDRETVIALKL